MSRAHLGNRSTLLCVLPSCVYKEQFPIFYPKFLCALQRLFVKCLVAFNRLKKCLSYQLKVLKSMSLVNVVTGCRVCCSVVTMLKLSS